MTEKKYTSYLPEDLTVAERHHLLLSAVAPRPIAFASTINSIGQVNLSPFSFFNVFSTNPPIMIFSPARSGRDGSLKHTLQNLQQVPEVAINVVNYDMVEQMSLASSAFAQGVNEFVKAGFSQRVSKLIKPPCVSESPVAFECKVNDIIELGQQGGAGNLVICEVLHIHVQSRYLNEVGKLDSSDLDLVGRMGGAWYSRASGESLFEVQKPTSTVGIGIDDLPPYVRQSPILTGNQLGKLGGLTRQSTQAEIVAAKKIFLKDQLPSAEEMHRMAGKLIDEGQIQEALSLLLFKEQID